MPGRWALLISQSTRRRLSSFKVFAEGPPSLLSVRWTTLTLEIDHTVTLGPGETMG